MPNHYVDEFLRGALSDGINRNIKRIRTKPDGSMDLDLFETGTTQSGITQQKTPPLSPEQRAMMRFQGIEPQEVGQVSRETIPFRNTSAIQPSITPEQEVPTQPQEGGGIGDIIGNPAVINAVADFGKAFSKNTGAGQILGDAAKSNAKSIAFKQYSDALLEGTTPPASVTSLLTPQEQAAAQAGALRQQQEGRLSDSASVQDRLNRARAQTLEDAPSFEEKLAGEAYLKLLGAPQGIKPSSATTTVKRLPDGTEAPPGLLFRQQFNAETGTYDINAGYAVDPSAGVGSGSGKDARPNASLRNQMQESAVTIMAPVIKDQIGKALKTSNLDKINEIYTAFKDQQTGEINVTRVRSYLTPQQNAKFSNLVKRFEDHFIGGGTISETESRIFNEILRNQGQPLGSSEIVPEDEKPEFQFSPIN